MPGATYRTRSRAHFFANDNAFYREFETAGTGDGHLDMVVVNHEAAGTPGSVSVLLGTPPLDALFDASNLRHS